MASFLDIDGVYDKTKRYIVTNWSDEDFTQNFGSETAYNDNKVIEVSPSYSLTIKPNEMRELGQFEAFLFTKHFVTREMYKDADKLTDPESIKRAEMSVNNRESRKVYEDKTISEIKAGQATPFMDKLRAEIRQEELAKIAEEGEKNLEEIKKDLPSDVQTGEFEE
jgi:hypothetical protein